MMADRIADRLAIADVMTRYAAGVDDRNLDLYRDCFADNAEIIGFSGGTVFGADAWLTTVKEKLAAFESTQHMLGPPLIRVEGDKAYTRTDVQALHYLKDQSRKTMTLWAVYLTDYIRIRGEWKITRHEIVRRGTRTQMDN